MWNTISCKTQYQEYLRKKQDDKLFRNLNDMKAKIDNTRPKTMKFIAKPKPISTISTRKLQINEENKSLLQRMLRIDLHPANPTTEKKLPEASSVKSLNSGFRRKKLMEIQDSNKRLLRRLQSTNSVYSQEQ
jgi:hypothetical protein